MKAFDPNYKLLDEMYQDDYYPAFLVDKVNPFLPKQISLPSQEWILGVWCKHLVHVYSSSKQKADCHGLRQSVSEGNYHRWLGAKNKINS